MNTCFQNSLRWLTCLLCAGAVSSTLLAENAPATTAIRANDFLNSIGVCTHITQGKDQPAKVVEGLRYTGIRSIRDDGPGNAAQMNVFLTVCKEAGVKMIVRPSPRDLDGTLKLCETMAAAGALLAVEGPNEPNNWHVTYNGATSSKETSLPLAQFQRDLYAAVKADPKLAGIPVFAASCGGGSQPDNCGLQFLTIPNGAGTLMPDGTKYADYANCHNYVCGHLQGMTKDNIAWDAFDPTLEKNHTAGLYSECGHTWWRTKTSNGFDGYTKSQLEALPRVSTENGWYTKQSAGRDETGGNANPETRQERAITEEQQGRLFLNLYLTAFKRNWTYTYIYMLHDHPGDGYWGLVHTDYTPKPSATYLRNLTTILADKSSSFTPGAVNYTIPNQPATVHDLLMQKSDGTFELAVWGDQVKDANDVTVNLGATYASVKVFDPTVGSSPIQTLANVSSVPLTLSDHAFIVEIAMATNQGKQ